MKRTSDKMVPEIQRNPFLEENSMPFQQPTNQYLYFSNQERERPQQDCYTCPFPLGSNNLTFNLPEPDLDAFRKLKADNMLAENRQSQQPQQSQFHQSQFQCNNQQSQETPTADLFPKLSNAGLFPTQNFQQSQNLFTSFGNNSTLFPKTTSNSTTFNLFSVGNNQNSSQNSSLFNDTPAELPKNLAAKSLSLFSLPTNSSQFTKPSQF